MLVAEFLVILVVDDADDVNDDLFFFPNDE
jgi:hypothetical protein